MTKNDEQRDTKKLTLAPLTFEETLKGLLQTPPPPKKPRKEWQPKDGKSSEADSE